MIEILNRLYSDKTMQKLYEAGFVTQRAFTYRATYLYYDQQRKVGYSVSEAVEKTAQACRVKVRTIYKIIKVFKEDDQSRNTDTNKG